MKKFLVVCLNDYMSDEGPSVEVVEVESFLHCLEHLGLIESKEECDEYTWEEFRDDEFANPWDVPEEQWEAYFQEMDWTGQSAYVITELTGESNVIKSYLPY